MHFAMSIAFPLAPPGNSLSLYLYRFLSHLTPTKDYNNNRLSVVLSDLMADHSPPPLKMVNLVTGTARKGLGKFSNYMHKFTQCTKSLSLYLTRLILLPEYKQYIVHSMMNFRNSTTEGGGWNTTSRSSPLHASVRSHGHFQLTTRYAAYLRTDDHTYAVES